MAFAAAKKFAAVFPVVGALIELQGSVSTDDLFIYCQKKVDSRLDTHPTIPRPQCLSSLQKNQIAVVRISTKKVTVAVTVTETLAYALDHL